MRVILKKRLKDFAAQHPVADVPLQDWRRIVEATSFGNFADLKTAFRATDRVGKFYVFDICGNQFRIVAAIHFNTQLLYVREVLTHKEYDTWCKLH